MADSGPGRQLLDAMRATYAAADAPEGTLTAAEHLGQAHEHVVAAGEHIKAASGDAPDTETLLADGRAMPAAAAPQAGYAQNRVRFAAGTGAQRAWRDATGRRG